MTVILLSIIAVSLFLVIRQFMSITKGKTASKLILIIILGLSLRILLATTSSLNFDMQMFILWSTELFAQGTYNIYQHNWGYVYSPAIFYITGILATLNKVSSSIPYPVIHR